MESHLSVPSGVGRHDSTSSEPAPSAVEDIKKGLSVYVNGKLSLLSKSSEFLAKGSGGSVYRYVHARLLLCCLRHQ
jgi:hypothetical protein